MQNSNVLRDKLYSIDGRGYGAYKSLEGAYSFERFTLYIDHVQSDPFAPPSRIRARVSQNIAAFPRELFSSPERRVALQDFLTREFARAVEHPARGGRGTGKSGLVAIDRCGQEILERTAMLVDRDFVEARFVVGLPARGRTVMGGEAVSIFLELVPAVVGKSLVYKNINGDLAREHVDMVQDQEFLRDMLRERGLVAFVGNGAVLPRESGISNRPLISGKAIPFQSPPELEAEFNLPNRGKVTGMGIPKGVTLIVGGGYHGKSTLLRAVERGVYNHIPGDGREMVITVGDAVKIRAEDGRSVVNTGISGFINNLPFGRDTRSFSSDNASGSTSQAANIVEALESGTNLLLLDEDTSATNFMIRDGRMQELVSKEFEPITPFIDRVRELYKNMGVSTILVVGGSGDYFGVADLVIMMQNYRSFDVTKKAAQIAGQHHNLRKTEVFGDFGHIAGRVPLPESFKLDERGKVKARGLDGISYGRMDINLQYVEQLVDASQTNAIADIIKYAAQKYVDGKKSLPEVVDVVLKDIRQGGLDVISPFRGQHPGDYALPRKYEIMAAVNRFRNLKIKQKG